MHNSININTSMVDAEDKGKEKQPKKKKYDSSVNKKDKEAVQELLSSALHKYADQKTKKFHDNEQAVYAINSTVEEFLKTFVIVGYTFNGELITITNHKTQQDTDALAIAITRFCQNHVNKTNGTQPHT